MSNNYWQTPRSILEKVQDVLGEDYFDPCPVNPTFDGLAENWGSKCFVNPPYSTKLLRAFCQKGRNEFKYAYENCLETGVRIQDFKYPEYIWLVNYGNSDKQSLARDILKTKASAICDIRTSRIAFVHHITKDPESNTKQDQVFYYWGHNPQRFKKVFSEIGEVFLKEAIEELKEEVEKLKEKE